MKRAYLTAFGVLIVGATFGNPFTGFWTHVLIYAPFVAIATWLTSDRRHSDFAWWCVLNPRQGSRTLFYLACIVAMKWSVKWKNWKKSRKNK